MTIYVGGVPATPEVEALVRGGLGDAGMTTASDLGSTAVGKGASLVGDIDGGTLAAKVGDYTTPYEAIGDGVTDDRAAFLRIAGQGYLNVRGVPGKRYYISAPITWTRDIDLDLNGATIVCPNGFLNVANSKSNITGVTGISVVENSYYFTVPTGLTLVAGDLVRLESDDVFCPLPINNPYLYGQYTTIVSITDGVARMADPAIGSYAINRVYVFSPLKISVRNGTLDLSGSTNPTGSNFPSAGVVAKGADIRFEGLRLIGGIYSGKGLIAEGRIVRARDVQGYGFLNVNGYGTTGGRWGYLMDLSGDDVLAEGCNGYECKHVIANGPRTFVTRNYVLNDCVARNPKGDHTRVVTMRDNSTELRYLAPFDAHGGVLNFIMAGVDVASSNNLISSRAKNVFATRLRLTSYGVKAGSPNQYLILQAEQVLQSGRFQIDKLTWDPGVSSGGDDSSASDRQVSVFGIVSNAPGDHGEIVLDLPRDGRVRWMEAQNNTGINIKSIIVRVAGGEWNGGLRLGGLGSVAIGTIGRIEVIGDATMKTAGSIPSKSVIDAQCAALTTVKVRGNFTATESNGPSYTFQFGNTTDAMVLPKYADFREVTVNALLTGFAFFTTSTAAPGKALFDGAKITYHIGGLAFSGQAINAVCGAAPTDPWTFSGTVFDDSATAQTNSQDIRWLANSYVDLSGASLTKAPALGNSDTKVLPVRCSVKGSTTLSLRQTGESSPYLIDYTGKMFAAALPAYTRLPVGSVVWNSAPVSGATPYWICLTTNSASGWMAATNLAPQTSIVLATAATITPDISVSTLTVVTALASALTINAILGTPAEGTTYRFRIKDNGTARAITWNAIYRGIGVTLPTTTTISKTTYITVVYNTTDTKWDVIGVVTET